MIPILLIVFVVAVLVFVWLKNKQYNRNVDRHNRMVDKQEELLQLLKDKKDTTDNDN